MSFSSARLRANGWETTGQVVTSGLDEEDEGRDKSGEEEADDEAEAMIVTLLASLAFAQG